MGRKMLALGLSGAMLLGGDTAANIWQPEPAKSVPTTGEQIKSNDVRSVAGLGCTVLSMTVDNGKLRAEVAVRGLEDVTGITFLAFKDGEINQVHNTEAAGDITPGGLSVVRGTTQLISQEGDPTGNMTVVATAQDHDPAARAVSTGVTCGPAYTIGMENGLPVSATPIQ